MRPACQSRHGHHDRHDHHRPEGHRPERRQACHRDRGRHQDVPDHHRHHQDDRHRHQPDGHCHPGRSHRSWASWPGSAAALPPHRHRGAASGRRRDAVRRSGHRSLDDRRCGQARHPRGEDAARPCPAGKRRGCCPDAERRACGLLPAGRRYHPDAAPDAAGPHRYRAQPGSGELLPERGPDAGLGPHSGWEPRPDSVPPEREPDSARVPGSSPPPARPVRAWPGLVPGSAPKSAWVLPEPAWLLPEPAWLRSGRRAGREPTSPEADALPVLRSSMTPSGRTPPCH